MNKKNLAIVLATLMVATAVVPLAAATHWTLYGNGVKENYGEFEQSEVNGNTVSSTETGHLPGALKNQGDENNVAGPWIARFPGDTTNSSFASIIVDSKFGADPHSAIVSYQPVLRPATGGEHILPGYGTFAAWSGYWTDGNGDGTIDDLDDYNTDHTGDEFLWLRGDANVDTNSLIGYLWPTNNRPGSADGSFSAQGYDHVRGNPAVSPPRNTLGGLDDPNDVRADFSYDCRVGPTWHPQFCVAGLGWGDQWVDDGFLMDLWALSYLSPAPKATAAELYDLASAAAVDVDRYAAVNAAVGANYGVAASSARAQNAFAQLNIRYYRGAALNYTTSQAETSTVAPFFGHEPNTAADVQPGATWTNPSTVTTLPASCQPYTYRGSTGFTAPNPSNMPSGGPTTGPSTRNVSPATGCANNYTGYQTVDHLFYDAQLFFAVAQATNADGAVGCAPEMKNVDPTYTGTTEDCENAAASGGLYGSVVCGTCPLAGSYGFQFVNAAPGTDGSRATGFLTMGVLVFGGLWRDLNKDGFIGKIATPDANGHPTQDPWGQSQAWSNGLATANGAPDCATPDQCSGELTAVLTTAGLCEAEDDTVFVDVYATDALGNVVNYPAGTAVIKMADRPTDRVGRHGATTLVNVVSGNLARLALTSSCSETAGATFSEDQLVLPPLFGEQGFGLKSVLVTPKTVKNSQDTAETVTDVDFLPPALL